MGKRSISPRRAMALGILALLILALAPGKWTRWLGWLREPTMVVLAPISQPMRMLGTWLRPGRREVRADDPAVAMIEQERDRFRLLWRQSESRALGLERLVFELQRGRALNPELDLAAVVAPIVGAASDLSSGTIVARAGRDRGVTRNTIAVVDGVHLVGRVVDVGRRTCSVLPITDPRTGWISASVDVGAPAPLPGCQLLPTGDGQRLRGDLHADAQGVEVGQQVRLSFAEWPAAAQMLVIGRIVSIEPKESQPLRKVITVEPMSDLRRVAQVVLLTPAAESREEGEPR